MSSHREAPSSMFTTVSLLAATQAPGNGGPLIEHAHSDEAHLHVNLNVTDFYVFQKSGDPQKSILIMNVNPMPPKLSDSFDPTAIHEFLIDTNGDAVPDIAFRVTFSPFANGQQTATVRRATGDQAAQKENSGDIILQNAPVSFDSQVQVTTAGEYRFFAGQRSDPFFFDLMGFCNNLHFTGTDYFSDKDVFGIALEVPNSALGPQPKVGAWCRVLVPQAGGFQQITRLGFPLASILFTSSDEKERFHQTEPTQDRSLFLNTFVALLTDLGRSNAQAQQIAQSFLPNILPYDASSPAGFFNGRKLTDDVADTILQLVMGGQATSDQVGPHSDYLETFPYLGAPHGKVTA